MDSDHLVLHFYLLAMTKITVSNSTVVIQVEIMQDGKPLPLAIYFCKFYTFKGTNNLAANSYLKTEYKEDMSLEDAIDLGLKVRIKKFCF